MTQAAAETPTRGRWKGVTLADRFDAKYTPEPNTGCWLWFGALTEKGYGILRLGTGRALAAHRLAWELANGPIPDGLVVDHTCRVRCCVNPAHLRAVTARVNALENSVGFAAVNANKTHCSNGHPFDRTYVHRRKAKGYRPAMDRVCGRCLNEALRNAKRRRRAAGKKN